MGPRPPRSTKAGAETPATRNGFAATWSGDDNAQRRPGPRPRRHPPGPGCVRCGCSTLNEGRGRDPGDTGGTTVTDRQAVPLNEGRGRDPGDTPLPSVAPGPLAALNEGRGRDPGDTRNHVEFTATDEVAQRRPGPRPRRHGSSRPQNRLGRDRSTKAGAETPATLPPLPTKSWVRFAAQRRPGPRPRRHGDGRPSRWDQGRRSTKAGAETPATPPSSHPRSRRSTPLNEGRGRDPGDTTNRGSAPRRFSHAQRRPGPRPRRHTRGPWLR